jgi:Leucine-rich repeat (LRR) protein
MDLPELWQLILEYSDEKTALTISLLTKTIRSYIKLVSLIRPSNLDRASELPMLSKLKRLDLSKPLPVSREALYRLVYLEELDISCNRYVTDVSFLSELRTLNAWSFYPHLCGLTQEGIRGLNKLVSLNISNSDKITDLNHLKELRYLKAGYLCSVTPEGICHLNKLVELDISCNTNFTWVPRLPNLTKLISKGRTFNWDGNNVPRIEGGRPTLNDLTMLLGRVDIGPKRARADNVPKGAGVDNAPKGAESYW